MLLRGFRLFGVALHREPKGTKRPTPGMGHVEGGSIIRALLTEFLRGFSLRTLIFLMAMVEEGKGEAYATKIDVRCNDRNRIIASKRILIATGGSATAEMSMRYSNFSQWLSRIWLAFMDESQQYGNYHEIAALAAIQQPIGGYSAARSHSFCRGS